jgi:hypothetical protein
VRVVEDDEDSLAGHQASVQVDPCLGVVRDTVGGHAEGVEEPAEDVIG